MYNVEKLVGIVCDLLEAETEVRKHNLEVRKEKGYAPDACLWIPSLDGDKAYRLGELSERYNRSAWILADICAMLDIDQALLVAAVKSMQRKERHNGRWDNPCLTCWMSCQDKERLTRFLAKDKGEHGYRSWYTSTGRTKAWCA